MKSNISPAALLAALSGQSENFVAAMTPGGIEAQEKRGQLEQAKKQTLPRDMGKHRPALETLGFVFSTAPQNGRDDIFIECQFPAGWEKRPTDHSMWSELVDANGRVRGMIFYKAAFYDRRADCHLCVRYRAGRDYSKPEPTYSAFDQGTAFKEFGTAPANDYASQDVKEAEALAWLEAEFPDFKNPLAYWDK